MSLTYSQRYYGTNEENDLKIRPFGEIRLLQICLNYQGTNCPLGCTIDGDRVRQLAQQKGVKDIITLYDDGSTQRYPSKQEVINAMIEIYSRSVPGDYVIVQYSGHGTHVDDQNGDESDGQDQALCLRTRNGQDQLLIDDDLAQIIKKYLNQKVPLLFFVDACHSGTIIDLTTGDWGNRLVFSISGCQDNQTSADTGDGGQMTNALLQCIVKKSVKKRRKRNQASIQFIFNRMVDKMPEDPEEQQEQDQEDFNQEEYDWTEQQFQQGWDEFQNEEDDPPVDEEPQPGQWLNLSWCGADPTYLPFPF